MKMQQQTMLSGMQPTGVPHLGNYLGAIRNWAALQREYNYLLFIADLHALTIPQNPKVLHENISVLAAYLIASGIDPKICTLFIQSHVPQHTQLSWILNCMAYLGELSRMTQFKDKSKKNEENLNAGLFSYPVLQAADILLYKPHFVPVGEDQRQHIELTRNLAERFNQRVKQEILRVPKPYIQEDGGRIMDLQDPTAKMSKSAQNLNGLILLSDSDAAILKKIKSAVTDSQQAIDLSNLSPGIQNLAEICAVLSQRKTSQILEENSGKMYGQFKLLVAEVVIDTIRPIREKAQELLRDEQKYLHQVLEHGAQGARSIAQKTIEEVYNATGLVSEKRLY